GTLLAIYGLPVAFLVALVCSYLQVRALFRSHEDATAAWSLLRNVTLSYLRLASLWYLASVVSLVHSYLTATDVTQRNQVKWIVFGALVASVLIGYTLHLI